MGYMGLYNKMSLYQLGKWFIIMRKARAGEEISKMLKYVCDPCGYVYDPTAGDSAGGIKPGTAFEDIPAGWVCPMCGAGKDKFYSVAADHVGME